MRVSSRRGIATSLGALAALVFAAVAVGQQGILERRDPSPTREQILDDLPYLRDAIANGETVTIYEGPPPDPDATPATHGDFRISPAGFVGTLERHVVFVAPTDPGPVTDSTDVASKSPLFTEPGYIPTGFRLEAVRSAEGMAPIDLGIELVYEDARTGDEFTIYRSRVFELPIDSSYDEQSPMLSMEFATLNGGRPALIFDWRPIDEQVARGISPDAVVPPEYGYRSVLVYDSASGILTGVVADGSPSVTLETLRSIIESIE